jgi:hypothetical protein
MVLSFDEERPDLFIDNTGHYIVETGDAVSKAGVSWARFGSGAVIFPGVLNTAALKNNSGGPIVIKARCYDALFSAGREMSGFSIEFWLYPVSIENGEEVLNWTAVAQNGPVDSRQIQNLNCVVSKNRFEWNFKDFFFEPNPFSAVLGEKEYAKSVNIRLAASTALTPKSWSHHLLRFNANTGLLEYLVNGVLEDIAYTTASGSEGGAVFLPIAGDRGSFVLGRHFNGMIDNFCIYRDFVEHGEFHRYTHNGKLQSAPIDIGAESTVLRVNASGGVYNVFDGKIRNKSNTNGGFNFPDGAQIQFFIRSSSSPYLWDDGKWQIFTPGTVITPVKGRYIELAAQFYPSADFETTPYLEAVSVVFVKKAAPEPPPFVKADAKNGSVELSWKPSKDSSTAGYLVYYGLASGDYFGEGSSLGHSPINAGNKLSINIDNLKNGIIYYFSVSSYDAMGAEGDFSREIFVRPLETFELKEGHGFSREISTRPSGWLYEK